MSEVPADRISALPAATPVSRLLRVALGLGLLAMAGPPVMDAPLNRQLQIAAVFIALIGLYTAVHLAVSRYFGWLHPWLGAVVAAVPAVLVFLTGDIYAAGVVLFIGASLLLMAATGQPGCEVLAFPALILGRRTHLACLLFSPIDWIEGMLRGRTAS
jgi:hypothetical protein